MSDPSAVPAESLPVGTLVTPVPTSAPAAVTVVVPPTPPPTPSPTPTAPPVATGATTFPNSYTWLTDFIGSANVQKLIGLVGGPVLATDFKTWTAKLASIGTGGLFTLAIHYLDALRAKNGA